MDAVGDIEMRMSNSFSNKGTEEQWERTGHGDDYSLRIEERNARVGCRK